jgi:DNA-binding CsgD family transcriptional regulator/N-acetylneuraminic acid mutarotase
MRVESAIMEPNGHEAPPPLGASGGTELSEREHEILRLVATGASNKQIAQQLVISPNTVKVHLRNIFGKIGVVSRTEAALYAVRAGLVTLPPGAATAPVNGEAAQPPAVEPAAPSSVASGAGPAASPAGAPVAQPAAARARAATPWAFGVAGLLVAILLAVVALLAQPRPPVRASPSPTAPPRWQLHSLMPVARSDMAAVAYDDKAYLIGGEEAAGITGANARYDPVTNSWQPLAAKPLPVADIAGAVIGGLIYVPGGRLASGQMSNALEVYDPAADHWEQKAPMPAALSGYALAQFEGKLYVFGGWTGDQYVATVYAYDPVSDQWTSHLPMPTTRGFAGAAVAAGKIYVVGGTAGGAPLAVNEAFNPDAGDNSAAWSAAAALPSGRARLAVASVADILQAVGGENVTGPQTALEFFPQLNQWEQIETPQIQPWSRLGLVAIGTSLYAFGGYAGKTPTATQWSYQALYTIAVPIVQ